MSTRAEMVEACYWAAPTLDRGPSGPDDDREGLEMGRRLNCAGIQLTRDGELRERLEKLVERQLARVEGCMTCHFVNEGPYAPVMCGGCQARMQLADELSALLKE